MTEEQKEILIAKMLDAPSSLSDDELDSILRDEELRDIYETSAALSRTCIVQPELDIEAEWSSFRPRIKRKPTPMRRLMRVAAIFLGVILATGVVVRIIDKAFTGYQPPLIAGIEQASDADNAPIALNEPLDEIKEKPEQKPEIVCRYSAAVNQSLAKAEVNQIQPTVAEIETDIDIDEYLRIQQARIDNDLAMQVAESYIEEYGDLMDILDAAGVYSPELDNAIRKVTME